MNLAYPIPAVFTSLGRRSLVFVSDIMLFSPMIFFLSLVDMRRDVQEIFRMTPHEKQVMMFSATLSKEIRPVCRKFMQDVNTLLPSLPPLPAHCLLPFRALFLQTPLSFKCQEGGTCPSGSDDSLKRHTEAETASVRVCAGARETPEDLVGLT